MTPDDVAAVTLPVERDLKQTFFAPVLDTLDPSERRFLRALAEEGTEAPFADVARRLGDPVRFDPATSRLAPTRDALLRRGVVFERDGRLGFALPYFERYLHATD